MNNNYACIKDEKNCLYIYSGKDSLFIDSGSNFDVFVDIENDKHDLYKIFLKYYKLFLENYIKNKKNLSKKNLLKNNSFIFISDNSLDDFANIFVFSHSKDHINLKVLHNYYSLYGSFVMLTNEKNYGKYPSFYNYFQLMLEDLNTYNKKLIKH